MGQPNKLPLAIQSLKLLINEMTAKDKIGDRRLRGRCGHGS